MVNGLPAQGVVRAPTINMKGDLVLADSQLQAKIMSVVDAEPARTKRVDLALESGSVRGYFFNVGNALDLTNYGLQFVMISQWYDAM